MTRAIVTCFHKYTPFGGEFYEPILDNFIQTLQRFKDEYDHVYFIDSNWEIDPKKLKELNFSIIKVDPSLRYYEAYNKNLGKIKEDLVLFMDDDMIVNKKNTIWNTFYNLEPFYHNGETHRSPIWDVVTIMDTIGTYKTDKLKLGNKFCPYWFATRTELLKKYTILDWGPDMPYCETLGHLTEAMMNDNVKVYEIEDDKTGAGATGTKELGFYHIRAGSVPAYLLATKKYGNIETYKEYLEHQPKGEIMRQCSWYKYMGGNPNEILKDLGWET